MSNRSFADLQAMQRLPLEAKVCATQARIYEWLERYGTDSVYVAFSGGKDSTVLLRLVREIAPEIAAVFVDTGLEYPEVKRFAKSFDNITVLRPKMRFDEVIKKYGYPLISKEVSECVSQARRFVQGAARGYSYRANQLGVSKTDIAELPVAADMRTARVLGTLTKDNKIQENIPNSKDRSKFSLVKWKPLLDVDFEVSHLCCNVMKKQPSHTYARQTGKKPMLGTMAEESRLRTEQWLKNGCNGFDMKSPTSNPMAFWTEQDVLHYIQDSNIEIAPVYGKIDYADDQQTIDFGDGLCNRKLCTTGCARTGCCFCGFGLHLEKGETRFQRLKRTHPIQYQYCLEGGAYNADGLWQPNKNGLGMRHVFDELNKIYGKDFMRYE